MARNAGGPRRRPDRKEQILAAAVTLFHDRGYHDTGIDDIGEAAGVTGPAVYRHFRSKEDILQTILYERGAATLAATRQAVEDSATTREALERLARGYTDIIIEDPPLAAVAMYERRTLEPAARAELDRMERLYVAEWLAALTSLRPGLTEIEARVLVNAALGLGLSICNYRHELSGQPLSELVAAMIVTALLDEQAPVSATGSASTPRRARQRPLRR